MLQKNVTEKIRERRRNECKSWKRIVKEMALESKMKANEEFSKHELFWMCFWMEMKKEKKRCKGYECEKEEGGWISCKW